MNTVPPHAPQDKPKPETTFIYALADPRNDEVRYVGKSNNPQERYRAHIRDCHKEATHKGRWITQLKSLSLLPILHIIEEVSIDEWQEREAYWIDFYHSQGAPLTNEAPGGIGMKSHTPEIRAKISAGVGKARAVTPDWKKRLSEANRGKKHTPEQAAKQSAAQRGMKHPPHSPEAREKLRQANLGKTIPPEQRAQISAFHKGRVKSPEECKHISEAKTGKKRKPFTEEAKRNMGLSAMGRKYPPRSAETRKKISDIQRGKKRGPYSAERRANITAGIRRYHAMKKLPPDAPTLGLKAIDYK